MDRLSLPFSLDRDEMRGHDAAHGVDGVVRIEEDALVVGFTLQMSTVGGAQVDLPDETPERLSESLDIEVAAHRDTVRIPFSRIDTVTMSGGIMRSPRLIVKVKDESALADLPWSDGRSCMMRMRRADGQALRVWLVEAELQLARDRAGSHVGR